MTNNRKLGRLLTVLCALILSAGISWAQDITVSGKVTDKTGEPVVGAFVFIQGTQTGASTDADGLYKITAPANGTLVFSCMGNVDQEVAITRRSKVDVILDDNAEMLEETVVTALGIKKERKALGYSVTEVGAEEILKNKQTNVVNSISSGLISITRLEKVVALLVTPSVPELPPLMVELS